MSLPLSAAVECTIVGVLDGEFQWLVGVTMQESWSYSMKIVSGIVVLVLFGGSAARTHGQDPDGYTRMEAILLPDTLHQVYAAGRFRISVLRAAADSADRGLITIAESLFPAADSIEKLGRAGGGRGHAMAVEKAAALPGARWWWRDWDGVLLPYALTGQAVAHYVERVRALAAGPNPLAQYNPGVQHEASVEYTARLIRGEPERGSVEVHLDVRFRFRCGRRCAWFFTHARVVEFDSAGRPVRIRGDRPPAFGAS